MGGGGILTGVQINNGVIIFFPTLFRGGSEIRLAVLTPAIMAPAMVRILIFIISIMRLLP